MDDTQIEMLPMLGEFSSIASQYEHIMFYYESGIQQIVAKLQILIMNSKTITKEIQSRT